MRRSKSCTCSPCCITPCASCGGFRYQTKARWTSKLPTRDGWHAHRIRVPGERWGAPEVVYVYPEFLGVRHHSERIEEQWSDEPYIMPEAK